MSTLFSRKFIIPAVKELRCAGVVPPDTGAVMPDGNDRSSDHTSILHAERNRIAWSFLRSDRNRAGEARRRTSWQIYDWACSVCLLVLRHVVSREEAVRPVYSTKAMVMAIAMTFFQSRPWLLQSTA